MKKVLSPVLLAALFLTVAPAVAAPSVCINTRDIKSSEEQDSGKALLFKMKDGTQWRNTLRGACPDLVYNGYVWVVRSPDETVCEDMQTLRVLQTGEVCTLGKFEKLAPSQSRG